MKKRTKKLLLPLAGLHPAIRLLPARWRPNRRHPGAIKIPATFVPQERGRNARLKVDLNPALERAARQAGLMDDESAPPEPTLQTPPDPWLSESLPPPPQNPVALYPRTEQAAGEFITNAAHREAARTATTRADPRRPGLPDAAEPSPRPEIILVSNTMPPTSDIPARVPPSPAGTAPAGEIRDGKAAGRPVSIGPNGYEPGPKDVTLLARTMFTEAAGYTKLIGAWPDLSHGAHIHKRVILESLQNKKHEKNEEFVCQTISPGNLRPESKTPR